MVTKKNIVVVGALGSVIGKRIVEVLAENNNSVITTYYNSNAESSITENGVQKDISNYFLDVMDSNGVNNFVKMLKVRYKTIDVLVYNAGVVADNLCALMKKNEWEKVISTNLTGAFNVCKYISRQMIRQKFGKVLLISSIKGITGSLGQANYSVSKAGLIAFGKSLSMELAPFNISVNTVCPGFISSKLNSQSKRKSEAAKRDSLLDINNNLNEVAQFVAFLSSSHINNVTGQTFNIDSRIC